MINNIESKKKLTAPCGLDCFNCELYEDNLQDDLRDIIHQKAAIPNEMIACKGCRVQDGKHFHLPAGECATLTCVKEKGVDLCSDCDEFPCQMLAPIASQAERYPHNFKLYNLCRIKKIGLERWINEEASEIRKRYFMNEFIVGIGQRDS